MSRRKNAGVYERDPGSGKFWIEYRDAEGCRHREMVGNEKRAIDLYHQRKAEIWEGRFTPKSQKPRITFKQLADARMDAKKFRLAARTYRTDELRLKRLTEEFGSMPVGKVSVEKINALLAELKAEGCGRRQPGKLFRAASPKGLSGSTVNRYRSLLSSIFAFGVRNGTLVFNPISRVDRFREGDSRVRFLSAAEEKSLRAAVRAQSAEHEAEIDLALHTGLRRGEQYGLTWDRVDLDQGILTVYGKTGRRFVPINSAAREAIEHLWRASNGSKFVCPDKRRDDQVDWRRWFADACAAAKIENFRWHDIRHTFASRLVMAGVDLRSVQELLGHKSIVTTQRYAHLSTDHQRANVQKLMGELRCVNCARHGREQKAVHISAGTGLCDGCFREALRALATGKDKPQLHKKSAMRQVTEFRRVVGGPARI